MPYANPGGATPPPGLSGPEWTDWYLNNEPNAGWVQFLQSQGLYGNDLRSRFARNQYNRVYGQYQTVAAQDPNVGFYDWLKNSGLDLGGEFGNLAPSDRGDFSDCNTNSRARFMRAY